MAGLVHPSVYAIDFGTSNSLLAGADEHGTGDPVPLDPAAADPTVLRTILHFSEERRWAFGAEALAEYVASGMRGRFMRSIKRFLPNLGFEDTLLGNRRVKLEEIISVFLREMRLRANRHFGADVRSALLGRPARFSDDPEVDQRAEDRLRRAAEIAGFESVAFCAEPIAAAYDFRAELDRPMVILVADFGGGTSDYTIMHLDPADERRSEVLAIGGVTVAGDALDGAIMRQEIAPHFGAEVRYRVPFGANVLTMPRPLIERLCSPAELCLLQKRDVIAFLHDVRGWSLAEGDRRVMDQLLVLIEDSLGFRLFESIEGAKRDLSSADRAELTFDYPGIEVEAEISRSRFEAAIEPAREAILSRLDDTLRAAGLTFADVDLVCCTGGTAKVPAIARGLRERFGEDKLRDHRSFHSVILGLAERAHASLRS